MGDYSAKALAQHQMARRSAEIAAAVLIRSGDATGLAANKAFSDAFMPAYLKALGDWGAIYGKQAGREAAKLIHAELETPMGQPTKLPDRSGPRAIKNGRR